MKTVGWCSALGHALIALLLGWIATESGGTYARMFAIAATPGALFSMTSIAGALLLRGRDWQRSFGSVLVIVSALALLGATIFCARAFVG